MATRRPAGIVTAVLLVAACGKGGDRSAAVDTTLPDDGAVPAQLVANDTAPLDAPTADAGGSFPKPVLPTAIEQTRCHMGECGWEQIVAIDDVATKGAETLRRVTSRNTDTETADEQEYPDQLSPGPHQWTANTVYVICSRTRPTMMFRSTNSGGYVVTPLHVVSPFGYETSAVATYKRACHGIAAGSPDDQHPDRLGYVDRQDDAEQGDAARPEDVF